jgi:hypothetical protein
MPREVIDQVIAIGCRQRMPSTITYADRHGNEIGDTINELDDNMSDNDSSYLNVISGCSLDQLTKQQKQKALRYLMFLKEKRCGRIKGWGCADGCKQRLYKTKEETSSPTVSVEALFLSCIIDAQQQRDVGMCDIPEAFMQADIDEELHILFEGELVDLLIQVETSFQQYVTQ